MINIEWQELPQRDNERVGEKRYFPRLKSNQEIDLNGVCEQAAKRGVYDRGTLLGAVMTIADEVAEQLAKGKTIRLSEIGTLQLSIGTDTPITKVSQGAANYVKIKGLRFQPDAELMQRIGTPKFRVIDASSATLSIEELAEQTRQYLAAHPSITRLQFEQLFHLKRSTANDRLKQLIDLGIIRRQGSNRAVVYVLT